ncbi:hypothetical protein WJX75_002065 [Coccomyxa subellipsoidea]|uniref:Fatty acid hydroxylase domain-containing protein n=1 Tax=Coccomyxa subellipsoidea TaxID=248742 RepID=A0ABR2YXK7_9CHLO
MLFKVGHLGSNYLQWVHMPAPGQPRFFRSPVLEYLTKTPWWVVPLIWVPIILACLRRAFLGSHKHCTQPMLLVAAGVLLWQLLEYCIHRHIFHAHPRSYWAITMHFGFHGCHHKFPQDRERLVFPPLPAFFIAAAIHTLLTAALPKEAVMPVFSGVLLGYLAYDSW